MRFIDLFCGCGGFSEGLRQAGHECILAVDDWPAALQSHAINHPEAEHWEKDVLEIKVGELPKADFIVGSPPCQMFSVARAQTKKQNNSYQRIARADKSVMNQFVKLAKAGEYKYWIMENVPPTKKLFPQWRCKILYGPDYGLMQRRKRAVFGNYPIPRKLKPEEKPTLIAPTVVASLLKGGLSDVRRKFWSFINRKPTIDDMLYWQSFPWGYVVVGNKGDRSTQVGNAFPPIMAKAIGEALI